MIRLLSCFPGAVLACAAFALPAAAQAPAGPPAAGQQAQAPQATPSHLAVAAQVAIASGVTRSFDASIEAVQERLRSMNVTRPEVKQDLEQVIAGLERELGLQKQQMVGLAASAFAKHLTEPELRELATFFATPTGKKYVEIQPDLFDDITIAMAAWEQDLAEYVMIRARAEMQKRGHALQ
jgi:uncharacterized protein